jgi:hypothetical protein
MGFWQVVNQFIPKIWEGVRARKKIKAIHIENIRRLEDEQTVKCDFDDLEESLLGEFASQTHFRTKSRITSVGSKKRNGYSIHKRADRDDIQNLSERTVRRIRIKNILSIIFWIFFILTIILLLGIVISLPQHIFQQFFV